MATRPSNPLGDEGGGNPFWVLVTRGDIPLGATDTSYIKEVEFWTGLGEPTSTPGGSELYGSEAEERGGHASSTLREDMDPGVDRDYLVPLGSMQAECPKGEWILAKKTAKDEANKNDEL